MSDLEAELFRTQLKLNSLEARRHREGLAEFLETVVNDFASLQPEVRDLMMEVIDEAAQETFRMREVYDTALTKMKQIKENAGE